MNDKIKTIEDANWLLAQAWQKIYSISKKEQEGKLHDLRMAINNLEVECINIREELEKQPVE